MVSSIIDSGDLPKLSELESDTREELLRFVKKQNHLTQRELSHTDTLQRTIYRELLSLRSPRSESEAVSLGRYRYFTRKEIGSNHPLLLRSPGEDLPEELVLNPNSYLPRESPGELLRIRLNPSETHIAFSIRKFGLSNSLLMIQQIGKTQATLYEHVGVDDFEWLDDHRVVVTLLENQRPVRAHVFSIGKAPKDLTLLHERDPQFYLNVKRTADAQGVFLSAESATSAEVYFLSHKDTQPTLLWERKPGVKVGAYLHEGSFLLLSNEGGVDSVALRLPHGEWKTLFQTEPDTRIVDLHLFRRHFVSFEERAGSTQLRTYSFADGTVRLTSPPDPLTWFEWGANYDYDAAEVIVRLPAAHRPTFVYRLSLKTGALTLVERHQGIDPDLRLKATRIRFTAVDGTSIPVTLVARSDLSLTGNHPLLLSAYGAYGHTHLATYSDRIVPLLRRGFVVANAHVRGGGFFGERWHQEGKLLNKDNTFSDLLAVADGLVSSQFTSPEKLVLWGRSAGALAAAVASQRRPELFRLAILEAPFVNVLETITNEGLPHSAREFEEWGNPHHAREARYVALYCPTQNVRAQAYPETLIRFSLKDELIPFWHPLKFGRLLQERNTASSRIMMRISEHAGHAGELNEHDDLKEQALTLAAIISAVDSARP